MKRGLVFAFVLVFAFTGTIPSAQAKGSSNSGKDKLEVYTVQAAAGEPRATSTPCCGKALTWWRCATLATASRSTSC